MSGKSILPSKRKRVLIPALALLVVALAATTSWARTGAVKWPTEAQETATSGTFTNLPFCGTKQITLGIHDGFGINAWSQESYAAVRSEAAKCPNVKQIVGLGGGDLQKSISDVNSMVAQGANAIVLIPDFGQASSPPSRQPTQAGVKVVPWGADPGGKPAATTSRTSTGASPIAGTMWANWMVKAARTARATSSSSAARPATRSATGQLKSIVKVFAKHPGHEAADGQDDLARHELGSRPPRRS